MADPDQFEYHDCKFCQSMAVDLENCVDTVSGARLHNAFFFEPTLDAVLLAQSFCPFAQLIMGSFHDSLKAESTLDFLKTRSTGIRLCSVLVNNGRFRSITLFDGAAFLEKYPGNATKPSPPLAFSEYGESGAVFPLQAWLNLRLCTLAGRPIFSFIHEHVSSYA